MLLWCQARIERQGAARLYGDTDSLFVESGRRTTRRRGLWRTAGRPPEPSWRTSRALARGERLAVFAALSPLVPPAMRHERARAYARAGRDRDRPRVVFTGMEAVRSDWTELAKGSSASCTPVRRSAGSSRTCVDVVARMRAGRLDARLVCRKALRAPDAYTATTRPHVAGPGRWAGRSAGRIASSSTAGPQPRKAHAPGLRALPRQAGGAVAEPVLTLLGPDLIRSWARRCPPLLTGEAGTIVAR